MTAVLESTADARDGEEFVAHQGGSTETVARRSLNDLIERFRPRVLDAVGKRRGGYPLRELGGLVHQTELSADDSGRIADALAEAMLQLISEGQIALTVDQKLVPGARRN